MLRRIHSIATQSPWLAALAPAAACAAPGPAEIRTSPGPATAQASRIATHSSMRVGARRHGVPTRAFDTRLTSLDGVSASSGSAQFFTTGSGSHVAVYQSLRSTSMQRGRFGSERRIAFGTRAGMTYAVLSAGPDPRAPDGEDFVWVHEAETGAIVAGSAPPGFRYACEVSTPAYYADCREE